MKNLAPFQQKNIKKVMQKYTAIILSSRNINEFDRLYAMYTLERGLVRAVARGVRRPSAKLAGHLEPATLSEVYVARSRGRGQITSAIALSDYSHIKKDFEKLAEVLKIFSFFLRVFSEEEKEEKIFGLLSEFLGALDGEEFPGRENLLALGFWWKLFELLGQKPEVAKCVECSQTLKSGQRNYFSVEKGGITCALCFSTGKYLPISDNQIKLIRIFLANSLRKIIKVKVSAKDIEELGRVKEDFLKYNFF
jgi:DNA repair protein RecO (recombination protein O)